MSLYDALSTVYDGVNKNPQNMLLLALTFLARVSPGKNSDRSIVLARLMDYVASIECQGSDPAWLIKLLERTHEREVKSSRWNSSRISTVRDRPRIPVAPSLSPFSQKQRRGKPRRNQIKGLKSKFIKDPNPRRKMQLLRGGKETENTTSHYCWHRYRSCKRKPAQRQHTKTLKSTIGNIESNVCGIHYIGSYRGLSHYTFVFRFCQLVHEAWRCI